MSKFSRTEYEKLLEIFDSEEQLLEIDDAEKILIIGDTHGYIDSTFHALEYFHIVDKLIFLGDYVDRGPYQKDNIDLLLQYKLKYPSKVILLRGNHETRITNKSYDFMWIAGEEYAYYLDMFVRMPIGAVISGKYLCIHGGIARGLNHVEQIKKIPKNDPDGNDPLLFEILWNDPNPTINEFGPGFRGPGTYSFGKIALERFLIRNDLKMLIRGHEAKINGYEYLFSGKLLTIFSATNYIGYPVKGKAGLMKIKDDLMKISFINL